MSLRGPTIESSHESRRRHGDPMPRLLEQLNSADADVRISALADLGHLGPLADESIEVVQRLLSDEDQAVRRVAARSLGQLGESAIPALAVALDHADKEVRRQAIWALARHGIKALGSLAAIGKALSDVDARTASGAAQALANMGPRAAPLVPELLAAFRSTNLIQCRLIAKALSAIGPAALPQLVARLEMPNPFVRREVAVALGFMGPSAAPAVAAIVAHLRRCTVEVRATLPVQDVRDTRITVIRPATAETIDERASLIDALARIGPAAAEAREYLLATLNDPDRVVGQAAAQALLRIMGWN